MKLYKLNPLEKLELELQLFADGGSEEKTEQATPRKKEKAREEGQVARSNEIVTAIMLVGLFALLKFWGPYMTRELVIIYREAFSLFHYEEINLREAAALYRHFFVKGLIVMLPILGMAMVLGFISNVIQVGWKITGKPLIPKLNRLSPVLRAASH